MTLVVSGVLMGALLPPSTAIGGVVSPASIGIVVVWTFGVYVINKVRKSPRWKHLDGRLAARAAGIGARPSRRARIRSGRARRCRWPAIFARRLRRHARRRASRSR